VLNVWRLSAVGGKSVLRENGILDDARDYRDAVKLTSERRKLIHFLGVS